jgi:hypothetical protein
MYRETFSIGLTADGIAPRRMNVGKNEPFWQRGKASMPPFIERGNGCLLVAGFL